jgi:hypothetical protein
MGRVEASGFLNDKKEIREADSTNSGNASVTAM